MDVAKHTLPSGHILLVRHGDLTRERVGAIVNAANDSLAHGGGVAGAIVRVGGRIIQDESDEFMLKRGRRLATGDVALTGSGKLPCEAVIHAVGPIWRGNDGGIDDLDLALAVFNALRMAGHNDFDSIALPAISSGIFGFPKARCARVMVAVAVQYGMVHDLANPRTISFTNFDLQTVNIFKKEFEVWFKSKKGGPGGGGGGEREGELEAKTDDRDEDENLTIAEASALAKKVVANF